jgi:fumarate reductase subunit C
MAPGRVAVATGLGGTVMNVRLYLLQRASAAILAPLVLVHLGVILYATGRDLSAAEILSRTRGSLVWGLFYLLFVLTAATHAAIGVRVVASEWTRLRGRALDILMGAVAIVLLALGMFAVAAVIRP